MQQDKILAIAQVVELSLPSALLIIAIMATSLSSEDARGGSPDPSSHAANIYDASGAEGEWLDETEDDDDMFEPTTDESEDAEFFDPSEDVEADFHGIVISKFC